MNKDNKKNDVYEVRIKSTKKEKLGKIIMEIIREDANKLKFSNSYFQKGESYEK